MVGNRNFDSTNQIEKFFGSKFNTLEKLYDYSIAFIHRAASQSRNVIEFREKLVLPNRISIDIIQDQVLAKIKFDTILTFEMFQKLTPVEAKKNWGVYYDKPMSEFLARRLTKEIGESTLEEIHSICLSSTSELDFLKKCYEDHTRVKTLETNFYTRFRNERDESLNYEKFYNYSREQARKIFGNNYKKSLKEIFGQKDSPSYIIINELAEENVKNTTPSNVLTNIPINSGQNHQIGAPLPIVSQAMNAMLGSRLTFGTKRTFTVQNQGTAVSHVSTLINQQKKPKIQTEAERKKEEENKIHHRVWTY